MQKISDGSITTPKGFKATGVACGIKKDGKPDLAMIVSDCVTNSAGVFTQNLIKGHSLQKAIDHMCFDDGGRTKAIVINSGNANACVGSDGDDDALSVIKQTAKLIGCEEREIIFGSTGVIGVKMNMKALSSGIKKAYSKLSETGGHKAEVAIMTTDLIPKEVCVRIDINEKPVTIAGMAKGSGMIHPDMATMIGVITTDASVSRKMLNQALKSTVKKTFNRVSIDGDTSVCDMVIIMANGMSETPLIDSESFDYELFATALNYVCTQLSKMIAKDGEGATKLINVVVNNALSTDDAYKVAISVAKSPLVKTAAFGEDANWGRIITAAGYSGATFNPNNVDIYIGDLMTCKRSAGLEFDEARAKEILSKDEITLTIDLKEGTHNDHVWTCDFSHGYIDINGSYRS
ncbi:MAG: bifunctional glutamate N-acetyltransferase/amino-acid acetyltransferase ArgJ [Clostridia bacterium]